MSKIESKNYVVRQQQQTHLILLGWQSCKHDTVYHPDHGYLTRDVVWTVDRVRYAPCSWDELRTSTIFWAYRKIVEGNRWLP